MSDQEIRDVAPQQTDQELVDLELDDVEGHGLREVAAGLGAAAVLAGGATAAVAATSAALPTVHPSSPVTVTVQDPMGPVDRATDQALHTARTTRDATLASAGTTAAGAVDRAQATVAGAERTAANAVTTAKHDVASVTGTAATVVHYTTDRATGTVSSTRATADSEVAGATDLAGSTVRTADRKVATVLSVTTTTAANGVRTATATLRAVDAGADVTTAGGWVLVKAGDTLLAQVHMSGGSATASWDEPVMGGQSITVTYTGDDVFAPADRGLVL